ncbi:hypothetical protein ACFYWP_37205 [Actinacidiphila glaucinigra]|uniref:hypothetical protein n=1 Tax=Actinacidiphila glaucinigra TaxID=235986 RepID=UPI0036776119
MTQTQQPGATTASNRGTKALRITTRVLREIGDRLEGLAVIAAVTVVCFHLAGITRFDDTQLVVVILAVWGAAMLIRPATYGFADWIDPDIKDGDDLFGAAQKIKDVASDIYQGADCYDVTVAVTASEILPAVSRLLGALGDAYTEGACTECGDDVDNEEAGALYAAGVAVRDAARHLGHKI